MAKQEKKDGPLEIMLPEGRLINHSLFEKDQYDDKSTPSYKAEIAFDKDALNEVIDKCVDDILKHYEIPGGTVLLDIDAGPKDTEFFETPFLDGNVLKRKREAKGKPGDAYADTYVIRCNTTFNWQGQDAPGGVYVCDENAEQILKINSGTIYQGCYVHALVSLKYWENEKTGNNAFKFYLKAVQKTRDGEKLVTGQDYSQVFKAVGRTGSDGASAGGARRGARKG